MIGVWNSAPYLHDGSAPTLEDVLLTSNSNDQHGATQSLTTNQISDLVQYLVPLDGTLIDTPADVDDDGAAIEAGTLGTLVLRPAP